MLLKTHASTALALSVIVDNYLCHAVEGYSVNLVNRFFIIAISVLVQYIIDVAGHRWKNINGRSVPVRNKMHSVPALVMLSVALGALPAYTTGSSLVILVPLSATMLHWLEDLVTEGGVYIFKKRFRLPFRASYDSPRLNRATCVLFMVLLFIYAKPFDSLFNFMMFSIATVFLTYVFLSA